MSEHAAANQSSFGPSQSTEEIGQVARDQPLVGKVAAVTGGGAGIGRASSLAFAMRGAAVLVVDRNGALAQEVVDEIVRMGGQALPVVADVSTAEGAARVEQTARAGFGGLDILHNNAGIQRYGTVVTTSEAEWDEVLNVNLKSYYRVSQACVPLIQERGGGAVVNTCSVQGLASQVSVAAYTTSKAGILGLTRSMAVDLAPTIRVNAVLPGAVDTPMLRDALATAEDPEAVFKVLESGPLLQRIARPEEIASVVVFLAGPDASFITGTTIVVDGGLMARLPGSPAE